MKIRRVEVSDFRTISRCVVELGSGLNVLYGPNDLGKSTLAQSIRSAFLASPTSTRSKELQPWSGSGRPTVTVDFDAAGERWKLRKRFTGNPSGKATLQCVTGDGVLQTKAEGRAVDGKLRELLAWGLPAPGGKKAAIKSTFLVTALLAEQGQVDSILSASIDDDPMSTGRELVTGALNAVGREPLVEQLFERLEKELKEVFHLEKATRRAGRASPLVQSGDVLQAAETKLAALIEERRNNADATRHLQDAMQAAEAAAHEHADATRSLEEVTTQLAAYRALREARQKLKASKATLKAAEEAHGERDGAALESERAMAEHAVRDKELKDARSRLERIGTNLEGAKEKVRELEAQRETRAAVAGTEREKRTLELRAELDAVQQRRAAAVEAQQARQRVLETEQELAEAEDGVDRAARMSRHLDLLAKEEELERASDERRVAEAAVSEATAAVNVQEEARRQAGAEVETQDRALETLRKSLEGDLSSEQQRETKLHAARSERLEIETRERALRDALERWGHIDTKEAALERKRIGLGEATAQLHRVSRLLEENESAAQRTRDTAVDLEALVDARALVESRNNLDREAERVEELATERAELARVREEMSSLTRRLDERHPLGPEQIERFRALEAARAERTAAAPLVASHPRSRMPTLVLAAVAAVVVGGGFGVVRGGFDWVALVLAFAASVGTFLAVRYLAARDENEQKQASREGQPSLLDERFKLEVEPSLRVVGVSNVEGLAAYETATREMREELVPLREKRDALDARLSGGVASPVDVRRLEAEVSDLEAKLAELDLATLCERASKGPPPSELKVSAHAARRKLNELGRAREKLVEERAQAQALERTQRDQHETLQAELEELRRRAEGDPDDLRAHEQKLAGEKQAVQQRIENIGATNKDAAAQAKRELQAQQERLDAARTQQEERNEELTKAREVLAQASTRHDATRKGPPETSAPDDVEAVLTRVRLDLKEFDDSERPTGESSLFEAVRVATKAQEEAQRKQVALRERRESASQRSEQLGRALEGEPKAVIESADTALRDAQAALTGLDGPSKSAEAATEDEVKAGRALEELALEHKAESELVQRAQEEEAAAAKSVAAFNKELEVRGEGAARQDLETLRGDVEKAQSEHDQLPHVEAVDEEQLGKAAAIQKQTRRQLSQAEGLQRNLQGRLEATGGAVLDERIAAQEELVERAQRSHEALEEKYEGERELYDTLSRLDESRTAHLGWLLAKPVAQRFTQLAGARYGDFELDASLTASGVQAGGALQDVSVLSVGTRGQLASLVRLALAELVGTAILLDDQLVHSDEARLGWFRQELRRVADAGVQVIVFTCRPLDYLTPEELARVPRAVDWDAGDVTAIDVEAAVG